MNTIYVKDQIRGRKRQKKRFEDLLEDRKRLVEKIDNFYEKREITYDQWIQLRSDLITRITNIEITISEIEEIIIELQNLAA